jgi:hypothetical protein
MLVTVATMQVTMPCPRDLHACKRTGETIHSRQSARTGKKNIEEEPRLDINGLVRWLRKIIFQSRALCSVIWKRRMQAFQVGQATRQMVDDAVASDGCIVIGDLDIRERGKHHRGEYVLKLNQYILYKARWGLERRIG